MYQLKRISCGRKPLTQIRQRQRQRVARELRRNLLSHVDEVSFEATSGWSNDANENLVSSEPDPLTSVSVAATPSENNMSVSEYHSDSDTGSNCSLPMSVKSRDESSTENDRLNNKYAGCSGESSNGESHFSVEYMSGGDENNQLSDLEVSSACSASRVSFRDKLAVCFAENDISHQVGNRILAVLRSHECFASLPKCTKTLLNTPRDSVELIDVAPGKYLHLGFEIAIVGMLTGVSPDRIPVPLEIDISTDGASPNRSGVNQVWPIQCRIANMERSGPAVIGVYWGKKKPQSAMDFMAPFVREANEIIGNGGVLVSDTRILIRLRSFIADAPARAFILNHKGHNSRKACSKCKVAGKYKNRRMTFARVDNQNRTDKEYQQRLDQNHHLAGLSPLSLLPMGLVTQVPFEYQHLVCLGVMKRLLMAWVDGTFSKKTKLGRFEISTVSARLKQLVNYRPVEFSRYPRDLKEYRLYKATELRQFLLYTGPTVLRVILTDDVYKHFLLLHIAFRVLSSRNPTPEQLYLAEEVLRTFVIHCKNIYGSYFVSYNVHGLLHVVDDVKVLGPVDTYSTFPYENNMKIFRKYCRKPHLPLQQIANRIAEKAQWLSQSHRTKKYSYATIETLFRHNNGPLPRNIIDCTVNQYKRVQGPRFTLDLTKRNSCCIAHDGSVCLLFNVIVSEGDVYLIVKRFKVVSSFFHVVIPSSSVGYYTCSQLEQEFNVIRFDDIATKGYLLPIWIPDLVDENYKEVESKEEVSVVSMSCAVHY